MQEQSKMKQLVNDEVANPRLEMIRQYVTKPIVEFFQSKQQGTSVSSPSAFGDNFPDDQPAWIPSSNMYIGSKYHAADIGNLKRLGIVAVLNCASGGISRLPVDELEEAGIKYAFTNCRQDHFSYPILHDSKTGVASRHLITAKDLYGVIRQQQQPPGNVLFFCVAGQNRSPALALAVLLLYGHSLDEMCASLASTRPFVLENVGFQWQLVELEYMLRHDPHKNKKIKLGNGDMVYSHGTPIESPLLLRNDTPMDDTTIQSTATRNVRSHSLHDVRTVEIELLIPGLCTMEVDIPVESTIGAVKERLVNHANKYLLAFDGNGVENGPTVLDGTGDSSMACPGTTTTTTTISKSWVVLAMFGYDSMYDFPLEVEAIDLNVQIQRMKTMFHLKVQQNYGGNNGRKSTVSEPVVEWNEKCRFALVILAVTQRTVQIVPMGKGTTETKEEIITEERPWTFVHEERPGAPATLLKNTPMQTNLRAWDFVTGQAFASEQPIIFSFSKDGPRDKRSFMQISTSANELQQFHEPGEGGILGMGANAIVHRVRLKPTSAEGWAIGDTGNSDSDINNTDVTYSIAHPSSASDEQIDLSTAATDETWDAAVKRPFGLAKMLAFLERSSEAGMAKRLRFANALNSDGRVLYFYGLGVGMSANAANPQEYKWEVMLLARYEKQFSAYTLRRFMEDYTVIPDERTMSPERRVKIATFQGSMSLISVKVLLVNLLNAFRDLTLMGVQAFDFNHLNNVLVSRDSQTVQLIDIDGDAKGSIQFPSEYIQGPSTSASNGGTRRPSKAYHKPSLDVDLNRVLPTVVEQLILGKGRGLSFTTNIKSEIWKADTEHAKEVIKKVVLQNFFPHNEPEEIAKTEKVVTKVAEWFYATLKRQYPWDNWTNDVYDALRCIDHLPIA